MYIYIYIYIYIYLFITTTFSFFFFIAAEHFLKKKTQLDIAKRSLLPLEATVCAYLQKVYMYTTTVTAHSRMRLSFSSVNRLSYC